MELLLIIIVLLLLFGGGIGYRQWGAGGGIGIAGLMVIILLIYVLFGR